MNAAAKLSGYGLVLAAAFAAALGVGSAVGPVSATTASAHGAGHGMGGMSEPTRSAAGAMPDMSHTGRTPEGLAVSADGYTLVVRRPGRGP